MTDMADDDGRRPQAALFQRDAPSRDCRLGESRPRLLGVPGEEFVERFVIGDETESITRLFNPPPLQRSLNYC
jgi:hypothetical protein